MLGGRISVRLSGQVEQAAKFTPNESTVVGGAGGRDATIAKSKEPVKFLGDNTELRVDKADRALSGVRHLQTEFALNVAQRSVVLHTSPTSSVVITSPSWNLPLPATFSP